MGEPLARRSAAKAGTGRGRLPPHAAALEVTPPQAEEPQPPARRAYAPEGTKEERPGQTFSFAGRQRTRRWPSSAKIRHTFLGKLLEKDHSLDIESKSRHSSQAPCAARRFLITPLIHAHLKCNLAQNIVASQRMLLYGILMLPSENQGKSEFCVRRKILLLSLLLSFLLAFPCLSRAWSGEVVGIADGDTITVLKSKTLKDVKIRLYGIDTPEKGQPFSRRAKQFASKMVYGKVVEVKGMATDRHGITVAMIYADKTLLNEELVKAGLAWVYWKHCHHPICESWKNFQLAAKFDKRGLWADADRIPPWEFRRKKRK